jgi:hypothetical protein
MDTYFFLIGQYLTVKEIDNCILLNKGFCQEIVNSVIIKNKRSQYIINSQRILINACLLGIKNSSESRLRDVEFQQKILESLKNFKQEGYHQEYRTEYIDIFQIKNEEKYLYEFQKNEKKLENILQYIPCLIFC